MRRKDDKFGNQLYFSVLFRQPKISFYWPNMRTHNLRIISFLPLTMCNRKIVDTIPPCKIIRSAETITFLVESRLSKIMLMVNAAIYPNIFAWEQTRIYFFNVNTCQLRPFCHLKMLAIRRGVYFFWNNPFRFLHHLTNSIAVDDKTIQCQEFYFSTYIQS